MEHVMREKAARVCGGMAEPNTKPHLLTYDDVCRYVEEMDRLAPGRVWRASIYATPEPNLKDILRCHREKLISHVKIYPVHGSTHTEDSPTPEMLLDKAHPAGKLMKMCEGEGIVVKDHPEVAVWRGEVIDPYYRERVYFSEIAPRMRDAYPNLKNVRAHISTAEACADLEEHGDEDRYVGEITGHHAATDRRIGFDGGAILVDHHCLPPIKEARHQRALQALMKKQPRYIMAGSDNAAHLTNNKYRFDAFGGLYTYHCDLELYVQVLAELGLLDYADDFLYENAKHFFGDLVPDDPKPVTLVKEEWTVDARVSVTGTDDEVTPFGYHPDPEKRFKFQWKLAA